MYVDLLVMCNVLLKFCFKIICKYLIISFMCYVNFGWFLEKIFYFKDLMLIIEVNFEYWCKIVCMEMEYF